MAVYSKSDWKLFRTRIAEWQEAYMERLVKEYVKLLSGAENASDKFWKREERIKKNLLLSWQFHYNNNYKSESVNHKIGKKQERNHGRKI